MNKTLKIAIPEGIASFPKLDAPDYHETYHPEGAYMCNVVMDPKSDEFEKLQATLEAFGKLWREEFIKEGLAITDETRTKYPFGPQQDKNKQPTGMLLVKTKMKAQVKLSKDSPAIAQRPLILGPDAHPYVEVPRIAGGSTVRVGADAIVTYVPASDTIFVSLRLRGVQIIELIEWGGVAEDQYDDYGFAATASTGDGEEPSY